MRITINWFYYFDLNLYLPTKGKIIYNNIRFIIIVYHSIITYQVTVDALIVVIKNSDDVSI